VPGFESRLNPILEEALCEKIGVPDISELREEGYLPSMEIYPSKNFILNDETITFIYNPHEIATFDKGEIELVIPFSSLSDILRLDFNQ